MIGRYLGIPVLALAAILNTTLMAELRVGGGAPDLVFLLVISWALLTDLRDGLLWAVVGGVMQDWLSVAPLGTSALGLVLVVFAADTLFGEVSRGNLLVPLVVAAAGTMIYHLAVIVVLQLEGYAIPPLTGISYVTVPAIVFNTLFILPVYRIIGTLYAAFQPRRARLE